MSIVRSPVIEFTYYYFDILFVEKLGDQLILNYENPRDIVPVAVNTMKKDIYLKEG